MRSGDLRDRIAVLGVTYATDAIGYNVETWAVLKTVWGTFQQERGSETLKRDTITASKKGSVIMRYDANITEENRVQINGVEYKITSVRVLNMTRRTDGLELVVERYE